MKGRVLKMMSQGSQGESQYKGLSQQRFSSETLDETPAVVLPRGMQISPVPNPPVQNPPVAGIALRNPHATSGFGPALRRLVGSTLLGSALVLLAACSTGSEEVTPTPSAEPTATPDTTDAPVERPDGWTYETHEDDDPNYDVVFPTDQVNRLDITISADNWQKMVDEMTESSGEFGASQGQSGQGGGGMGGPPTDSTACEGLELGDACSVDMQGMTVPGTCITDPAGSGSVVCMADPTDEAVEACASLESGDACSFSDPMGGEQSGSCTSTDGVTLSCQPGGGGGGGMTFPDNMSFVPSTVQFNGNTWTNVGIRFKGNSSLQSPWSTGVWKLPFKLDFDEFEDEYPAIDDQRFYGFKQLSLSNGWSDSSLIHEKVMDDLFRLAGIPCARSAFYQLYIDHGEGSTYFGLYTVVETVSTDMLKTQLGNKSGNLYKPEMGTGSDWTSFSEDGFPKESNEDEADWSDVQAAIDALHADRTDAEAWRTGLEATFDVSSFIRWLAFNTLAVNWDTYGNMAHNYYLYADPDDDDRLLWIPWDNSFALTVDGGMVGAFDMSLDEVGENWPLIRYVMDDPTYEAEYRAEVADLLTGAFSLESTQARVQAEHDLIAPYVLGDTGEVAPYTNLTSQADFSASLDVLLQHIEDRRAAAEAYLAGE